MRTSGEKALGNIQTAHTKTLPSWQVNVRPGVGQYWLYKHCLQYLTCLTVVQDLNPLVSEGS